MCNLTNVFNNAYILVSKTLVEFGFQYFLVFLPNFSNKRRGVYNHQSSTLSTVLRQVDDSLIAKVQAKEML